MQVLQVAMAEQGGQVAPPQVAWAASVVLVGLEGPEVMAVVVSLRVISLMAPRAQLVAQVGRAVQVVT